MSSKRHRALRIPLTVDGGIRSQSFATRNRKYRASVRERWWSRKWLEAIEGFRMGARLGRGRNYAMSGQVASLSIDEGLVQASVQGISSDPYFCFIRFAVAEGETKRKIESAISEDPVLCAQLLNGFLPQEIEVLFKSCGLALLPTQKGDIWSQCSCPDYANPCKHLAAVYYLVGETIAHSPLLLLKLRGIELAKESCASGKSPLPAPPADASPPRINDFYKFSVQAPKWKSCGISGADAPLLKRLGPIPLWRGEERFEETLSSVYRRCADRARRFWF